MAAVGGIAVTKTFDIINVRVRDARQLPGRVSRLEHQLARNARIVSILARAHQEALKARYNGEDTNETIINLLTAHQRVVEELATMDTETMGDGGLTYKGIVNPRG